MTSDTIGHMTDEPTKDPSDEPTAPVDSTPPPPPSEPAGVGFAALKPPGQQPPSQPPQGYQAASPPTPPPSPRPVYQYDYSRTPKGGGNAWSMLIVGGIAFALVLVAGFGGMLALGIGPFARATPSPAPTLSFSPRPTPTAAPGTPAPTGVIASPAPSPTGSVIPTIGVDPQQALLSHIPVDIADSCFVSAPDDASAILALAVCDADGGDIRVTYFQYDDHDSMFSAYSGFRIASQIEPDSGDCDDKPTWPTENIYNIGEVPAGRLLCTEELSETSLYWTDDRLNILSQATHTGGDHERLIEFWTSESGPNL